MKRSLIIIIVSISTFLIFLSFKAKKKSMYYNEIMPGTIKISENYLIDQIEIRNLDYREYLHWLQRIFGSKSNEYKYALPDTSVWLKLKSDVNCITIKEAYLQHYLRHPYYMNYPVVGVTQKQAQEYLNWRSDRIFHAILIRDKILQDTIDEDSTNYFTIKRYYKGQYNNIKPDPNYQFYPKYYLPSKDDFKKMIRFNDSIINLNKQLEISLKRYSNIDTFQIDINTLCNSFNFIDCPTRNVSADWVSKHHSQLYNLIGNVSEWLSDENICAGKSWNDKKESSLYMYSDKPTAYIGFRAVCRFVKNNYVP